MQKARLLSILLALLVLLSACTTAPGKQSPSGSTAPEEQPPEEAPTPVSYDADNRNNGLVAALGTIAETEDAYYFTALGSRNIIYSDKATGQQGVLCSKPDCTHTDETCSGYIGVRTQFLQYYGGKLYWVGFNPEYPIKPKAPKMYGIWRMNTDGSGREPVKITDGAANSLTGKPEYDLKLHRGRVYILTYENIVEKAEPLQRLTVYSASLEGDDGYVPVYEKTFDTNINVERNMSPVGDGIYICVGAAYGNGEERTYRFTASRYDILTGRTETLCDMDTDYIVSKTWVTEDGNIYAGGRRDNADVVCTVKDGNLTELFSFYDPDFKFSIQTLSDNIVCSSAYKKGETVERYLWAADLEGKTLYKGPWDLTGDSGQSELNSFIPMRSDRGSIICLLDTGSSSWVRWDITENGLKRVPIIGK